VADICDSGVGRCLPMSGGVGSVISKSGMVENVGVPLKSFRYLFPFRSCFQFRFSLPVSWPTFAFPVSADVGRRCSVISKSGMVENVGVAVEIASPSVSVQKLCPLPVSTSGFVADIAFPVSADVGPC